MCETRLIFVYLSFQLHITFSHYNATAHRAVHQDGVKCLEMLLKADHTYFKDHRGRTVLHLSAEAGSLTACELIIRLRADAVHDLDRMVSNTLPSSISYKHV